jgi:hypothetical protein
LSVEPKKQPDRIKCGAGLILVSVDGVAEDWGIPEESLQRVLSEFAIPTIRFPGQEKRYVSLWSLEYCLFEAGLPQALKGNQAVATALLQAAGYCYKAATEQAIRDRVKSLARELRKPKSLKRTDQR